MPSSQQIKQLLAVRLAKTRIRLAAKHGWVCWYCQDPISLSKCEVDHIWPVSRGGKGSIGNLALTCKVCNRAKGDMPLIEFRAWLRRLKSPKAVPVESIEKRLTLD